jgi:NTE family protein
MAIHERKIMKAMKDSASPVRVDEDTINIKKDGFKNNMSSTALGNSEAIENVLILQGGGSLGAFGCGVFKALSKKGVKIDIVAGKSIGGVNAAIIAGSKNEKQPEQRLEEFWLELADNFVDLDNISPYLSPYFEWLAANSHYFSPSTSLRNKIESIRKVEEYRNKSITSFLSSAMFGNDKMFKARCRPEYALTDPEYFEPAKWTYLYDHSPLEKTLERYIDYEKLKPDGNPNSRLIMTAVNVLTSEPLTFDSSKQQITPKHILATCGYPAYNFPWVEVEKGVYCWDGGLLSNTPLREVIDASPVKDKRMFLVENYQKKSTACQTTWLKFIIEQET